MFLERMKMMKNRGDESNDDADRHEDGEDTADTKRRLRRNTGTRRAADSPLCGWSTRMGQGYSPSSRTASGRRGMALGGGLGGVIFDLAGSSAEAFFAGAGFNAVNLILASFLFIRRNHNCAMAQIG